MGEYLVQKSEKKLFIILHNSKFFSTFDFSKRGQRYTNCTTFMYNLKNELLFSTGAKVAFKGELINAFIRETTGNDENLMKYQKMVLGGINQIGEVEGFIQNLVNVSYPDGWMIPIHPKYLQVVPEAKA